MGSASFLLPRQTVESTGGGHSVFAGSLCRHFSPKPASRSTEKAVSRKGKINTRNCRRV